VFRIGLFLTNFKPEIESINGSGLEHVSFYDNHETLQGSFTATRGTSSFTGNCKFAFHNAIVEAGLPL
jgi:hypothetical protein